MGKRYQNKRGQVVEVGPLNGPGYNLWAWYYEHGHAVFHPTGCTLLVRYSRAHNWPTETECQAALDQHAARMGWEEVTG